MNRSHALMSFCLSIGVLGWALVYLSAPAAPPALLLLFVILAILTELAGFRIPPADPHSLTGMVLLSAALALGPANGALVAAVAGLVFGVLYPLLSSGPRSLYLLVARPVFRSGLRAMAILAGAAVAARFGLAPPWGASALFGIVPVYVVMLQVGRAAREYLQGGRAGLSTWWVSSWQPMLLGEVMPLPGAALLAAIYTGLGIGYFVLSGVALLAASMAVRQAMQNLRLQRRSVRELALLNEASRAIIRAELDVDALCELIYRQASRVVDTSSFHLGLFDPGSDRYTLVVRIQDRVRLPRLSVDLPSGDGIVGWMRQTGRALLVEDFTREMDQLPARPRYQSERPPRSGIYVPLINGETVIGSISIQSYRPNAFGTDDMRMLSLIADQAAVAIGKARAYEDARQRAGQLQAIHEVSERITAILDLDELLPSVVRLIREHFGYHPVHIFTLEQELLVFRASTAEPAAQPTTPLRIGDGIVGSVAQSGQPLVVNDVLADRRYIGDDRQTRSELAVPLRFGDEIIGVLDLQSALEGRFQERDLAVMQTLADQIAVAIESARAFMAQREEAWTLNALLQVTENILRSSSFDDLLRTSVRLAPLFLGCDRCYCLLWARDQGTLTPRAAYGLSEAQRQAFIGWPFGVEAAPALEEAIRSIAPVTVEDAGRDRSSCPPILEPFGGQSLLALPLWSRGTVLGLLVADYDAARQRFSQREMTIYGGIAGQMAGVLENMLLAEEAAAAGRLEEELRVARGVQTALLPERVPDLPGWDTAAAWHSARIVGGDFYDYWWLPLGTGLPESGDHDGEQRALGFVSADVSDKGVPAAMFMALSRSLVRAAALDGSAPSLALVRANRWITRDSESAMFVTIFYGIINPQSGVLTYSCAGHNPPLLCRADGEVTELSTPGIALGVLDEIQLGQARLTLDVGDMLVCYTDGVTEAFDTSGRPFGTERLIALIRDNHERTAGALLELITSTLFEFSGGPLADDVTLVVVKRIEGGVARAATAP